MTKKIQFIDTNKPFPAFSLEADRDYLLARLINFSGAGFAPRTGYFGQQAIEKYMKAFLVQNSEKYLKTHDLLDLANECGKVDKDFIDPEFLKDIKIFDDFEEIGRYGGEAFHDPYSKKTPDFETAGVYSWAEGDIRILDEVVHLIRGKLDYKKVSFSDSLLAILDDSKVDFLAIEWKLPIRLSEILTTGNNYFKK